MCMAGLSCEINKVSPLSLGSQEWKDSWCGASEMIHAHGRFFSTKSLRESALDCV